MLGQTSPPRCFSQYAGSFRPLLGAQTNQPPRVTLAGYLRTLGYESILLKRGEGNHLFVEASIENKKRTLLLETGAGVTEMDKRIARRWKSLGELGAALSDPTYSRPITNSDVFVIPEFQLGKAIFTNQPAFVRSFAAAGIVTGEDGCLGCEFFLRNHCLLDCRDQRLYVRGGPPSRKVRDALEQSLRVSGMKKVELGNLYPLRLTCPMRVNGEPVTLLLDTGAFWTILDDGLQKRCGLRPRSSPMQIRGVRGNRALVYATSAKALELGGIPVSTTTPLGVADMSDWGIGTGKDPSLRAVDGVLGHDLLLGSRALIDFDGMCVWILPQQPKEKNQRLSQ